MTDRMELARAFVAQTDWAAAEWAPLAGDASNRRYLRLHMGGQSAVLMDAPPERGEDVVPFITIAEHLESLGLSAPRILAQDRAQGFLLLEDLGDDLYARVLARAPEHEHTLYTAAVAALAHLHDAPPPDALPNYSPAMMADLAALAFDWYAGTPQSDERHAARDVMQGLLESHAADADVLIQRDYHAENLLWLPERTGVARVGLLDFQDAMAGHRAYDLVSLLQDARRDVPPKTETAMIAHYLSLTGLDPACFDVAYHVLGAQRNLRIIGVFARLCLRDGKAHYAGLIPRVWALLQRDLGHPALAELRPLIVAHLPKPTPKFLTTITMRSGTCPTP
ncbi:phosphotransferase [Roseovarius sp. LXJ103]|uniref:aminoglycoside phosphotransferase family protein n=1 Tax=Roseovarius carneus TaxID=2853164 RepID=UPI000D620BE7|nr:phosphotransferase [Roseovarius carneus]MBZ8117938.1 phosphotransferase [Roseovarius carneus]PWE36308.1 aminoglycoside phosphotransferase [Pelagicola sp. LXJ1103]